MAKEMRPRRFSYVDDYRKNEKGEYEYTGTYYVMKADKREERAYRLLLRFVSVIVCALAVASGCLPAPGMSGSVWLLIPYALCLIAVVTVLISCWRLCLEKSPVKEYVYKASVKKIPIRTVMAMILSALCFVSEIVCLIMYGDEGHILFGLLFMILQAGIFILDLLIFRKTRAIIWEKLSDD